MFAKDNDKSCELHNLFLCDIFVPSLSPYFHYEKLLHESLECFLTARKSPPTKLVELSLQLANFNFGLSDETFLIFSLVSHNLKFKREQ